MKPSCNLKAGQLKMARKATGLLLTVVCACWIGCGFGESSSQVVHGTVTVDGRKADGGLVRFFPIDGTPGGANAAEIIGGGYRIEARGGAQLGKYRVEVTAKKKSGRQVAQDTGIETVMGDEMITISPPQYAGKQSPLVAEITAGFDGRFDIEISTQ